MIIETITYRSVEVRTDFLLDLAGIKSSQGMPAKEVEACIFGMFPKWRGLKIFVQVPVFDDTTGIPGKIGEAVSSICIETTRTKTEHPVTPSATLVTVEPVMQADIDRIDGALLFILEQVGLIVDSNQVLTKVLYSIS